MSGAPGSPLQFPNQQPLPNPLDDEEWERNRYTTAERYEALFPEEKYEQLPQIGKNGVLTFLSRFPSAMGVENHALIMQDYRASAAVRTSFLACPDKFAVEDLLADTVLPPTDSPLPRGTMFMNENFIDLLERGERFSGGILLGRIPIIARPGGMSISKLLRLQRYLEDPKYMIGVVNKLGQPSSIIHYIHRAHPRMFTGRYATNLQTAVRTIRADD